MTSVVGAVSRQKEKSVCSEYLDVSVLPPNLRDLVFPLIYEQLLKPITPLEVHYDEEAMAKLFHFDNFKDNYKVLNQEVRKFGINVPPLVNAYMSLSPKMRVFGTAINHEFGEVEETGILIKINEILEEKKKRHIETFLKEECLNPHLIRK